jgi:hypothetical protein
MFKCQKGLLPNQLKPYNSIVIIHGCDRWVWGIKLRMQKLCDEL